MGHVSAALAPARVRDNGYKGARGHPRIQRQLSRSRRLPTPRPTPPCPSEHAPHRPTRPPDARARPGANTRALPPRHPPTSAVGPHDRVARQRQHLGAGRRPQIPAVYFDGKVDGSLQE